MAVDVTLRPPLTTDVDAIVAIFDEPDVAQWWPRYDRARIEREFVTDVDDDTAVYVIEVDGEIAGVIQSWEEPDQEYRHAGMDIAVGTRWHGKDVAIAALRGLARHLVEDLGHHHLTIDPAAANVRAIRCYEKLGYRPVGILRQNELGADGTFHDTWLMDLVAEDLVLEAPIAVIRKVAG
ncbi:MAG TPA: GNAT family protein [Acidimicrobiales bacterium]|jgi:aminoglycoside 6'-N-acetyltransferase|nr:GNAT family protein [Acidimicrobiales bacterium]